MKKQYFLASLVVYVAALLVVGPNALADDRNQLYDQFQALRAHRAQMELRLCIDPRLDIYPRATSYYDDLVDHYEQVQLVRDMIDQGIR